MKKTLLVCTGFMVLLGSCASLTKSQVETVNQFARMSRNFSAYPGKIISGLAALRVKKGLYFVNAMDDDSASSSLHVDELNKIYDAHKEDLHVAGKVDITFKIIDKYAQSLLLLSSDKHAADLDSQAVYFGTNLDSLITTYNAIPGVTTVRAGLGSVIGSIILAGGKQIIRSKQATAIKEFVPKADTLIGVMTHNLLEFLESDNIYILIDHEEKDIPRTYKSFLNHRKPTLQNERDYLALKSDIDHIKILRDQTIEATRNLRKAHARLLAEIKEKKDIKEVITELQVLYEDVKNVKTTIGELDTATN
jgi:hypothetical protein